MEFLNLILNKTELDPFKLNQCKLCILAMSYYLISINSNYYFKLSILGLGVETLSKKQLQHPSMPILPLITFKFKA